MISGVRRWSFLKLSALIFSLFNSNSSYKFVTALCLNVLPHLKQMSSYQPSALDPTTTTPVFANMMKLARSHESWVVVLLTKLWNVLRQLLLFAMCAVVLLTRAVGPNLCDAVIQALLQPATSVQPSDGRQLIPQSYCGSTFIVLDIKQTG